MNQFIVNEQEVPHGHCAVKVHEDENCYVSFGQGNTLLDQREVACIDFKNLDVKILGGKSLRDHLKSHPKEDWYIQSLSYMINNCDTPRFINFLDCLLINARTKAYQKGFKQAQENIRKALGEAE